MISLKNLLTRFIDLISVVSGYLFMSYPSDNPEERGSGLILASSSAAKKAFGISNVSRARDLSFPYPADPIYEGGESF